MFWWGCRAYSVGQNESSIRNIGQYLSSNPVAFTRLEDPKMLADTPHEGRVSDKRGRCLIFGRWPAAGVNPESASIQ